MKRIISFLFVLLLLLTVFSFSAAADDISSLNVCYRKPVTSSSRMQFNEIYPLNLTDGNYGLRASTHKMDILNPYEWFRIDLGADYTISEIVISAIAELTPRSMAIDVWSNGKWVRVVQDYNIETADYPKVYYFDEIDASYIHISTSELTNMPSGSTEYVFSIAEVEAYHTKGISDAEKAVSFEATPQGASEIPVPQDMNALLFRQGKRSDGSSTQDIPEDDLLSFMGQHEGSLYYKTDIDYLKSVYGSDSASISYVLSARAQSAGKPDITYKTAAINDDYYYETAVDWNPILLYGGIALIGLGVIGIVITLIVTIIRKKKNK